jgi:hypothetical protein
MKYIFVAGAPGSKWSSVVKNIYYSPSLDQSDYSDERTYYHDASGRMELMHIGAYYDPGMEFGDFFDELENYTKEQCEAEFDRAFSGKGVRIIKSHVFANKIDVLRERWPECPVVCVHRPNDACLGWWVKCGEFYITYPTYHDYYENLPKMAKIIAHQNAGIEDALRKYPSLKVGTNTSLATNLGIQIPPGEYFQDYAKSDVDVRIIK